MATHSINQSAAYVYQVSGFLLLLTTGVVQCVLLTPRRLVCQLCFVRLEVRLTAMLIVMLITLLPK